MSYNANLFFILLLCLLQSSQGLTKEIQLSEHIVLETQGRYENSNSLNFCINSHLILSCKNEVYKNFYQASYQALVSKKNLTLSNQKKVHEKMSNLLKECDIDPDRTLLSIEKNGPFNFL